MENKAPEMSASAFEESAKIEAPSKSDVFLRRVYFERDTMNVLLGYHMEGDVVLPSVEDDWATYPALAEYAGDRENVDVLEWRERDAQVEEVCGNALKIGVRRLGAGPAGCEVFDDTASMAQREQPGAEMDELVETLIARAAKLSPVQWARLSSGQAKMNIS